ncbi:MAG: RraA family protein [Anaerolineae bacterium]|jgi:regulator of RNase E activity RraA
MIVINDRNAELSGEVIERYRSVEPATVGHLLEFGFCDPALQPLWRPCQVVGRAFTVRTTALDSAIVHLAIDMAERGDVLVIDRNGDRKHACWGGMTSLAAKVKGLAGAVVDGCVTDIDEIEEMAFPVYARGLTTITTKGLALEGEINTQVQIGGVPVSLGDLVVADSNGVLILTPEMAAQMVEESESRQKRGQWVEEQLRSGVKISELSGAAEKLRARMEEDA